MGLITKCVKTYDVKICDTLEKCVLPVCVTKIEQRELLTLENPNYPEMLGRYPHLKGVRMEETDTKELLPIHVILGANEYTKIKMAGYQRAGAVGEPIAEQTRFGWTIMSSGAEVDSQNMFLTQTSIGDYEELCRMDVLGLQDTPIGDQDVVHKEFLEQLKRSPEGWYETALPWKGGHPPLPNNKTGSLKRLASLVQRLKRNGKLEDYDAIILQQLEEGVVEEAEVPTQVKEFYIPHKAVIRESSEITKMRIAYDASARAYDEKAWKIKATSTEIFGKASFKLHKWNSNVRELEAFGAHDNEGVVTYAKEQLGVKPGECGLLGLRWNKDSDTIAVTFPQEIVAATKRGVLGKMAKVYDPLGLVSPLTLEGKMLYRDACQKKMAWDAELPQELLKRWQKWEMKLPAKTEVPRIGDKMS